MTELQQITELKETLKALRAEANTVEAEYAPLQEKLEDDILALYTQFEATNSELCKRREDVAEKLDAAETNLRAALIAAYAETGEKTIEKGLSVRVTTKLEYNEAKAVTWAETNAPACIKKGVDKKSFEALAKTQNLDFVTVKETVSAVIASEL